MSAREAHEFAVWLQGRLPTCNQWDKAAGLHDPSGRSGPFDPTWRPGDKTRIAVDREAEGPLPVGTAPMDISPFLCRDMAGNGFEWTRNSTQAGILIPLAPDADDLIILRGHSFARNRAPLLYEELKDSDNYQLSEKYLSRLPDIGFRVVLDIDEF